MKNQKLILRILSSMLVLATLSTGALAVETTSATTTAGAASTATTTTTASPAAASTTSGTTTTGTTTTTTAATGTAATATAPKTGTASTTTATTAKPGTATTPATAGAKEEAVVPQINYLTEKYASAAEKLATMKKFYETKDYEFWAHEVTGEVGLVDKKTKQIMLSNPYDIASAASSEEVKQKLMSQVLIKYSDSSKEYIFNSYAQGALNNQIKVKKIRGGIRVEYTMGREEVKKLLPRMIEKSRFEEAILSKVENQRQLKKLKAYYLLKDLNDPTLTARQKDALAMTMPITKKYAVYVIDPGIVEREMYELEAIVMSTGYTFEMLEQDHAQVEYDGADRAPALFKLAIEYYADDYGIKVRVPANGIRYDSSNYQLLSLQILPYLCAGNNLKTEGYTMIPDGSGTIVRFSDVADRSLIITGKLYGQDYSFHNISGSNQEIMRLPAFGVVSSMKVAEEATAAEKAAVKPEGFVAYLEEGDSMAEVSTDHGGSIHPYSSVYPTFYPRPNDTYALTGISATGSATWTVKSDRRYTGNYTLRLFPLSGDKANYSGMAEAVQTYLVKKGVLTKLKENGKKDIPLYLENYGTIKTSQKKLGIPVKVHTPLTTFEETQKMLDELRGKGIENVNVKFTGWYNGGLIHTVPYQLKVAKAIGGSSGLKDLVSYAEKYDVGLYPEMEFTYVEKLGRFDGFSYKNDTAKTIDDRSANHRVYSALYQGFQVDGNAIISTATMERLYDKTFSKYEKFKVGGLSVATLGSDLNSDNNKDYPLNREDSKLLVTNLLKKMKKDNGSVLVSGGNSYTWPYADHILDLPLDSSKNIAASEAIPFMGMVLHGYKEYAGTAINLEGDYEYSLLKAIENGANPYFILSYNQNNTSELKNFENFSKFYSIRYDIWEKDLVSTYQTLNDALKDVRFATIKDHAYIDNRVVKVTYSNGRVFILNYNNKAVTIDGQKIEALSFIKK